LLDVATAHTAWRYAERYEDAAAAPSPLASYAARLGVAYAAGVWADDWPDDRDPPAVWAMGHQLFIHTISIDMPRALGHLIYERGGRVCTEIVHAHHPLIALFEIHWPHTTPDVATRIRDLVATLLAADGPLVAHTSVAPAWRTADHPGFEPDLVVAAVLSDLVAGFAAVHAAVTQRGGALQVRMLEAIEGEGDPLAFMRVPAPAGLSTDA
jgi:hypothetical protein